jgi:regulator of replication initiation timing
MAQNDLKKKLADTQFEEMARLREITDEMFTRFVNADAELAGEKARNVVLMQEIQRLEQENGNLRTELVDTEERYWKAHEEVEAARKTLHDLVGQIAALVEENRKMKRELGERIATAPAEPRNDSAACECPKCGSADTVFVTVCGEEGLQKCKVCDAHYEVE